MAGIAGLVLREETQQRQPKGITFNTWLAQNVQAVAAHQDAEQSQVEFTRLMDELASHFGNGSYRVTSGGPITKTVWRIRDGESVYLRFTREWVRHGTTQWDDYFLNLSDEPLYVEEFSVGGNDGWLVNHTEHFQEAIPPWGYWDHCYYIDSKVSVGRSYEIKNEDGEPVEDWLHILLY